MAQSILNVGTSNNSGDGEGLRQGMIKVNANFTELYNALAPLDLVKLINTAGFGFYVED